MADMRPEMTPERWRRIKAIAGAALDRPDNERAAYIDEACGDDRQLRDEVASLLRSTARASRYLETPAGFAPPLAAGVRVGPWRVLRQLGEGGMGVVYLAERADGGFEQRAALKLVRSSIHSGLLLQRFLDERQILATLEHPNIARLIDGGTTESGVPYVALEYIEGEPIDVYCDARGLGIDERVALVRQVCAAVHYAHQRLVVHRDIKAGNILVGADGVPKLLDFGIAKLIDPARDRDRTRTLWRMVTPESASPEQVRGEPVTTATDVYGLGILLYRLLTGVSPYRLERDTEASLVRAVCEQTPLPPSKVVRTAASGPAASRANRTIPPDLDHVVGKALRKEPERRYGTAEELAEDLRRYLTNLPVLAAPDSWSYRARKMAARHRVAVIATGVVLLALALGTAATAWQARVASRERNRAERQFDAVRTLASSVLWELHDAVGKLPGSIAAQELLLTRATEYLDRLAAETGDDLDLRREVAAGYLRLAQVQGAAGLPNLGNTNAARSTYLKAAGLLEGIPQPQQTDGDRQALATAYVRVAGVEAQPARQELLAKARLLVEGRTGPPDAAWLRVAQALWNELANDEISQQRYQLARGPLTNMLAAAEAAYQAEPQNTSESRNLSLAYKRMGALLHVLDEDDDAMALYQRALALDRARVDREPHRGLWRLDLSFSYASIASLQTKRGELQNALASQTQAVALREEVVAANPDDDFARVSLARGYERMASTAGRAGDVGLAIAHTRKRLAVYRERVRRHPAREAVWRDYTEAALGAIGASLDLAAAETTAREVRRAAVPSIRAMLTDLEGERRQRKAQGSNAGAPSDDELAAVEQRLMALGR